MIDKFLATVAALAVAFAVWCGLATLSEKGRADKAEAQVAQLQRDAETAKVIAQVRADAAQQALDVATHRRRLGQPQAGQHLPPTAHPGPCRPLRGGPGAGR